MRSNLWLISIYWRSQQRWYGKKKTQFFYKKIVNIQSKNFGTGIGTRICGDGWISLSVLYPCLRSIAFTLFSFLLHPEVSWAQAIWMQNQLCQEGIPGFRSYIFSDLRHMIYSGFPSFFQTVTKTHSDLQLKNLF